MPAPWGRDTVLTAFSLVPPTLTSLMVKLIDGEEVAALARILDWDTPSSHWAELR